MQACRFFLDDGGFATKSRQGRRLPYAWNPLIPVPNRTISLPTRYVLAIVPFVIRRPWSSGLGWPGLSGVVAFPKLSKLLNQERALSAPCLHGEFCSPHSAPSRGAPMLRKGVIRHFDVTLPFAAPKSSGWQALMFTRWLAAMHGQSAPVQGQA